MGAWGTAIFSDDTAADIRGDYKDYIGDGLSPIAAKEKILLEWKGACQSKLKISDLDANFVA